MIVDKWFLIVRGDGSKPRVVGTRNKPPLRPDEMAFPLMIRRPDAWGTYGKTVEVDLPMPPEEVSVQVQPAAEP